MMFRLLYLVLLHITELFDIPFIVVTGSVGKTTTKEMIAQILKSVSMS